MKRIISAFLATAVCTAAMSIVLTACSSKTADSSTTTPESTSTSTVTETAEDAADNTQIPSPIGQYTFTYNGGTYTLRAAKDTGDISGVWENGTTLGNGREGDVTAITTENGGIWSRWFDGDMQYSLYAEGAAMDDYTAVRNAMA